MKSLFLCLLSITAISAVQEQNVKLVKSVKVEFCSYSSKEACELHIPIAVKEKVIDRLSVCFWVKPYHLQESTNVLTLRSSLPKFKLILSIFLQRDLITLVDMKYTKMETLTLTVREWVHLCFVYDQTLSVIKTIPGQNDREVFITTSSKFQSNFTAQTLDVIIGSDFEKFLPMIGELADIRIYYKALNGEEVINISNIKDIPGYSVSVFQDCRKDCYEDKRPYIEIYETHDSDLLSPYSDFVIWHFDAKVTCLEAVNQCKKFGGIMPSTDYDILAEFVKNNLHKNNLELFWLTSTEGNSSCVKGLYKNESITASNINMDLLESFCLIPKVQKFYFTYKNINKTLFAADDTKPHLKCNYGYSEIFWGDSLGQLNYLEDGAVFLTAVRPKTNELIGRYKWDYSSNDGANSVSGLLTQCQYEEFTCSEGDCIPISKICDNTYDCEDGSDENNCEVGIIPEEDYNINVIPSDPFESVRKIDFTLKLLALKKVDFAENTVTLRFTLTLGWKDPRLRFKNLKLNKTNNIDRTFTQRIWNPNIQMDNAMPGYKNKFEFASDPGLVSAETSQSGDLQTFGSYEAFIFRGGNVDLIHEKTENIMFHCGIELLLYPFDSQTCSFCLALDTLSKNVEWNMSSVELISQKPYVNNYRVIKFFTNEDSMNENEITITLIMAREYRTFILTIFLPCILLCIIGLLTFFMPIDDYNDRLNVTLSGLIVMAALFTQVSGSLPETPTPKLIDVWMFTQVFIFFLIFIFNLLVITLHQRTLKEKENFEINYAVNKLAWVDHNDVKGRKKKNRPLYDTVNKFGFNFCTVSYLCFIFVLVCFVLRN